MTAWFLELCTIFPGEGNKHQIITFRFTLLLCDSCQLHFWACLNYSSELWNFCKFGQQMLVMLNFFPSQKVVFPGQKSAQKCIRNVSVEFIGGNQYTINVTCLWHGIPLTFLNLTFTWDFHGQRYMACFPILFSQWHMACHYFSEILHLYEISLNNTWHAIKFSINLIFTWNFHTWHAITFPTLFRNYLYENSLDSNTWHAPILFRNLKFTWYFLCQHAVIFPHERKHQRLHNM